MMQKHHLSPNAALTQWSWGWAIESFRIDKLRTPRLLRAIAALAGLAFSVTSCTSRWIPVESPEKPPVLVQPEQLVGKEARFHMVGGDVEYLKVTEVSAPYVRGYGPEAENAEATSTIDLREVDHIEVFYSNDKKVVVVVVVLAFAALAFWLAAWSDFEIK